MTNKFQDNLRRFDHPISRARERYGIVISAADIRQAERDIIEGRGAVIGKQNDGRIQYIVMIASRCIRVVFCPGTRHLITVLPAKSQPRNKHFGARQHG